MSTSQNSTYSPFKHPILVVVGVLLVLLVVGTIGYMVIERWSLLDALYMTIITITTIGFGEVRQLSIAGRIFTIGLIIIGVLTASYAITMMVELFASEEFQKQLDERRRRRRLRKLNDHCIICGFGRLGRSLAYDLQARGAAVVVIDQNNEKIERCGELGIPAVLGNAADERILQEAGIERAGSLVAAANSDAENVFIVLTAAGLNPKLHIIARCNSETSIPKLEKAGAQSVISPYSIAGRRIGQMLTHPRITRFLDGILEFGDEQMRLEEFAITANSPLANLALKEARLKVAVLAVSHPDQELLSHPNAETRLLPGAAIIAMGTDQELKELALKLKE